jgi:ferredoxin/flavodoxin---NADP+ reductase
METTGHATAFNATLIYRRDLNAELAVVRIRPDSGAVPEFQPGQYCTIGLLAPPGVAPARVTGSIATPTGPDSPAAAGATGAATDAAPSHAERIPRTDQPRQVRRAYSIASSPSTRDYVELLVVLVNTGRLTPRLWDVAEDGRLWMSEKIAGHFTLDGLPPDRDAVMVSTGTGIAPFVSMLRTYAGQKRWRRCALINGVRSEIDLAYRDEIMELCRRDPGITYIPTLTREPADSLWGGPRGRVQSLLEGPAFELLAGTPLDPARCHVYLCGNPAMITDVQHMLAARGFTLDGRDMPGNLHFERYW